MGSSAFGSGVPGTPAFNTAAPTKTLLANGNTRYCFQLGLEPTFRATGLCANPDTLFHNMNPDCCNKVLHKIEMRSHPKCQDALVTATVDGVRVGQSFQVANTNTRDWSDPTSRPLGAMKLVNIQRVPIMSLANFPRTAGASVPLCLELKATSACPNLTEMCRIDQFNPGCVFSLFEPTQKCCPVDVLPALPANFRKA